MKTVAVILGAGQGTRIKGASIPKQFIKLHGAPMIVQTVEKFALINEIEKVLIVVSKPWMSHAKDIFRDNQFYKKMVFVEGGVSRQESLFKACKYIETFIGTEVGVVSHDAARPFVSLRIIEDNISCLKKGYTCDTVLSCTDTIVRTKDGVEIYDIPNRNDLCQGQTPQSFFCSDYIDAYTKIGNQDSITDAAKLLLMSGIKIKLVPGDPSNLKITTDFDLAFSEFLFLHQK